MVYCFSISYSTSPAVCIRFISILASIWRKAQKSFQIQSIYKETSFKNSLSLWVMVAIQSLEIVFSLLWEIMYFFTKTNLSSNRMFNFLCAVSEMLHVLVSCFSFDLFRNSFYFLFFVQFLSFWTFRFIILVFSSRLNHEK